VAIGKLIIIFGVILILVGISYEFMSIFLSKKIPLDFKIERENFTIFIPIGTSIIISIALSVVFYLLSKF
tara:strand:+ start:319 stop:528 length:210 start_codon:yes stop_codon:yes gene_type:complete